LPKIFFPGDFALAVASPESPASTTLLTPRKLANQIAPRKITETKKLKLQNNNEKTKNDVILDSPQ